MPLDPSIPLQVQTPQPMQALSNVLNIGNQAQQYQNAQIAGQQAQQNLQSGAIDLQNKKAAQAVIANPANWANADGSMNLDKLTGSLMRAGGVGAAAHARDIANAYQQVTAAHTAVNSMDADSRTQAAQIIAGIGSGNMSPAAQGAALDAAEKQYPALSGPLELYRKHIIAPALATGNPDQINGAYQSIARMVQPTNTQQEMATPGGVHVTDQQGAADVSVKPGTAVAPGQIIPGTAVQMQPPPTTPVINGSGQPGLYGARGSPLLANQPPNPNFIPPAVQAGRDAEALKMAQIELQSTPPGPQRDQLVQAIQRMQSGGSPAPNIDAAPQNLSPQQGFIPTGLAPGQAQNRVSNFEEMGRHYSSLQDVSSGAPLVGALTGNIKTLAETAITGTEADRKAYLNGLLNALGAGDKVTGDVQKDTDLLKKQFAQLNTSTKASTDAAQTLINAGRPNSGMSAAAISEAADQIASQVKANMAIRNFLTPYKFANGGNGDPQGYQAARQQIEGLADPRIWQMESMSHAQMVKMLKSNPELAGKAATLAKMGLIQ